MGGWARGGGGGGLVAGLRVGRPVGVLPPWGVIVVAALWPMGTQPPLATQALTTGSLPAGWCFFYFAQNQLRLQKIGEWSLN